MRRPWTTTQRANPKESRAKTSCVYAAAPARSARFHNSRTDCNSGDKMKLFHIYDLYLRLSGSAVFRVQQSFEPEDMGCLLRFPFFTLHPEICLSSPSQTGPCTSQLVNAWLAQQTESYMLFDLEVKTGRVWLLEI